ncbi:MAG: lipoate--protein ligase family protein [Spirochaetaceae bacterium]|jgi:lipoate-protein ligase A|nr:lipoate--protein ligase family protein [Spirochaetaceae bacterium]
MKYPCRLLRTGYHNGFYNMGLDQALLEAVAAGSLPTLRFYGWKPAAVSVGYFQSLADEVDLAACKRRGVDVVRRLSGGGAVFHHAEITYSIVLPVSHPLAGKTIADSYGILCAGITRGLALLGIDAQFAPINDIVVNGRKVSGNAQTRRMGCALQHGTVLLDNAEAMFDLLTVPVEKVSRDGAVRDVTERVTSLRALLGREVSLEEAEEALAHGFCEALSLDFCADAPLTEAEETRARELGAAKFSNPHWPAGGSISVMRSACKQAETD